MVEHPLAKGLDVMVGTATVTVPQVTPGDDYQILGKLRKSDMRNPLLTSSDSFRWLRKHWPSLLDSRWRRPVTSNVEWITPKSNYNEFCSSLRWYFIMPLRCTHFTTNNLDALGLFICISIYRSSLNNLCILISCNFYIRSWSYVITYV